PELKEKPPEKGGFSVGCLSVGLGLAGCVFDGASQGGSVAGVAVVGRMRMLLRNFSIPMTLVLP
ncbi:hypothetical protein, partial [Synechococcus sp. BA-132 BA5]|uniref:hypothetical protein n=1 Tax=Synechococcus sp. BA-132 BA5 TaxID=3110252 RepID=UPI002B207DBC